MDSESNEDVEKVFRWLGEGGRVAKVAKALRDAIDYVLDDPHTGRYEISQLDKSETIIIGLKIKHFIVRELKLKHIRLRGQLDTIIEKVAIDIIFSHTTNWMIPMQAVGEVCLLVSANDRASTFDLGVFHAREKSLTQGGNQDKKRSLTSDARENRVRWVKRSEPLP